METCQFVGLALGKAATDKVPIVVDELGIHHDHNLFLAVCDQINDYFAAFGKNNCSPLIL